MSQGLIDSFWLQSMMAGHKNAYECIKAFSETDQTEDLKRIDVPVLQLHGDDDQIVPFVASALKARAAEERSSRSTRALHGIPSVLKDRVNEDLLAFIKG